jgi:putative SOS response-associated peptidase YedK
MCGRYRLSRRKQVVEEYFDCGSDEPDWNPRFNIAPTQPIPVIRQNPKEPVRELSLIRWGLIPSWAKDPSVAVKMINARSETASTKPAFRDALKSRRCLIPADGFYEWMRTGKTKQPYYHDAAPELVKHAIEAAFAAVDLQLTVFIYGSDPEPNFAFSRPNENLKK